MRIPGSCLLVSWLARNPSVLKTTRGGRTNSLLLLTYATKTRSVGRLCKCERSKTSLQCSISQNYIIVCYPRHRQCGDPELHIARPLCKRSARVCYVKAPSVAKNEERL